jgi:hypothetical protein
LLPLYTAPGVAGLGPCAEAAAGLEILSL